MDDKAYTLLGADRRPYRSAEPGTVGGHRSGRIYGRLDCPSALRALSRGRYAEHRVFFADEAAALAAGYRPCGVCLPKKYRAWRSRPGPEHQPAGKPFPEEDR
jgi:methylphosphotriester-DNA--protein-cysteine methyltransferase